MTEGLLAGCVSTATLQVVSMDVASANAVIFYSSTAEEESVNLGEMVRDCVCFARCLHSAAHHSVDHAISPSLAYGAAAARCTKYSCLIRAQQQAGSKTHADACSVCKLAARVLCMPLSCALTCLLQGHACISAAMQALCSNACACMSAASPLPWPLPMAGGPEGACMASP